VTTNIPQIVGISGTNGSGKDTFGHVLADEFNLLFISVTDILREELARRKLKPERSLMRQLSSEWRKQYGLGVLIDKALEIYNNTPTPHSGLAISSLRNPGEADRVHGLGGQVVWLDADPLIRYNRIQANAQNRGAIRAVDDQKTFDEFLADEQAEMHHQSNDITTLSASGVKAKADIFLENESNNLESFVKEIKRSLVIN
jgi:shikimate kinase